MFSRYRCYYINILYTLLEVEYNESIKCKCNMFIFIICIGIYRYLVYTRLVEENVQSF